MKGINAQHRKHWNKCQIGLELIENKFYYITPDLREAYLCIKDVRLTPSVKLKFYKQEKGPRNSRSSDCSVKVSCFHVTNYSVMFGARTVCQFRKFPLLYCILSQNVVWKFLLANISPSSVIICLLLLLIFPQNFP